jgi:hypothetical protein
MNDRGEPWEKIADYIESLIDAPPADRATREAYPALLAEAEAAVAR